MRRLTVPRPAAGPQWLALAARLLLAGVFATAGWPKLLDSEGTVRSVRAFQLMPQALVRPFAYGLPALELALAVLLLVGLGTRWAALVTAGLLAMFLFGIATAWARGLTIECGCFGNGGLPVLDPVPGYVRDLARDVGLLAAALFLAFRPRSRMSLDVALGLGAGPAPLAPAGSATPAASSPRPRITAQKPGSS